jgi:electron transfer flavoprotein beta subunit
MNIVVCIKQVPETTEVRINPETNTLIREGVPSIINPFDENAIEEALRIKEAHGGKVTVITMGPPQAAEALRKALAMGADEVILISDRAFAGSDTLATSYALSQAIKKMGQYDLIICGKQAIDGDTAQVGPGVAEWLGIPQVSFVVKTKFEGSKLAAERLLEDENEVVEVPLPALISVVKQINEPRYPSLKGQMRAKKATITTWTAKDVGADENKIGLKGSPTWVVKIFTPPQKSGGEILTGEVDETTARLADKIKKLGIC